MGVQRMYGLGICCSHSIEEHIMEEYLTQKRYQSPYKYLRIGEREYAVLDKALAAERAAYHLAAAQHMLAAPAEKQQATLINKELILATDFGSTEAPFLFALRVLDPSHQTQYPAEDVAVFLKIAVERGCIEAAYRLACSYAGFALFTDIEEAAQDYFNSFESLERARLAEYYFDKAIAAQHQLAVEQLMIAYAEGRGHIKQDIHAFTLLCEQQCFDGNQAVMVAYGAWLLGIMVEGTALATHAVVTDVTLFKGLEYLLEASKGNHLETAEQALHLICVSFAQELWNSQDKKRVYQKMINDAVHGNSLLALYLAWYSIPRAQRKKIPDGLFQRYQLNELAVLVCESEHDALVYLKVALFGKDEDVSAVAKEILSHVVTYSPS
jgi:hypothetical protein